MIRDPAQLSVWRNMKQLYTGTEWGTFGSRVLDGGPAAVVMTSADDLGNMMWINDTGPSLLQAFCVFRKASVLRARQCALALEAFVYAPVCTSCRDLVAVVCLSIRPAGSRGGWWVHRCGPSCSSWVPSLPLILPPSLQHLPALASAPAEQSSPQGRWVCSYHVSGKYII